MPVEVSIPTRAGQVVRADLYLPPGGGPAPVLFAASPYQKALAHLPVHPQFPFRESGPIDFYLDHGYAYLWADVPGSGRSDGVWDMVSRAEGEALYDVIEWAAAQDWSTGRVGMIGESYYCWSQWNAARMRPPSLVTIAAFDGGCDLYRDWYYKGGIPDFGFISSWNASILLQHQAMGYPVQGGDRHLHISNVYSHPFDDEWHRERSPFWELDQVTIPALSVGVWPKGSLHMRGNVEGFRRLGGPKKLLMIAAANASEAQKLYSTPEFHQREILPWYEHHLKGVANGVMDGPDVRMQVNRTGQYRTAGSWPPPEGTATTFLLSGERSGAVRSLNDGSLTESGGTNAAGDALPPAQTSFSYPDPEWTAGTTSAGPGGPDHVRRIVTFTTATFDRAREFTGDGVLVLFASTDQQDIDVVARLSLLSADGGWSPTSIMSRGWLRASRRAEDEAFTTEMRPFHRHDRADKVVPGEVYQLRVPLVPMSFVARPGERLRLELSCADSPAIEGRMFQWYGLKAGTDTYHHDASFPSRLVLPEMPAPVVD
jgi:predicted acyl esterase